MSKYSYDHYSEQLLLKKFFNLSSSNCMLGQLSPAPQSPASLSDSCQVKTTVYSLWNDFNFLCIMHYGFDHNVTDARSLYAKKSQLKAPKDLFYIGAFLSCLSLCLCDIRGSYNRLFLIMEAILMLWHKRPDVATPTNQSTASSDIDQ